MTEKILISPSGTTVDNIAVFDADGQIEDSGLTIADLSDGIVIDYAFMQRTSKYTLATTVFTQIPSLSATITPKSATNRILIIASLSVSSDNASTFLRLKRDSTAINIGNAAGTRIRATKGGIIALGNTDALPLEINYIDSPATTSAVTYSVDASTAGNMHLNRSVLDMGSQFFGQSSSSILALEIAT